MICNISIDYAVPLWGLITIFCGIVVFLVAFLIRLYIQVQGLKGREEERNDRLKRIDTHYSTKLKELDEKVDSMSEKVIETNTMVKILIEKK